MGNFKYLGLSHKKSIGVILLFFGFLLALFFNNCSKSSTLTGQSYIGETSENSETFPETPFIDIDFKNETLPTTNNFTFIRNSIGSYYKDDGYIGFAANNIARFDHDPAKCEIETETIANDCIRKKLGLLIEETRTNLLLNSSNFTLWQTGANTTITENDAIAPDGSLSATRVQMPNLDTTFIQQNVLQVGKTYTASLYAKANGQNQIGFLIGSNANPIKVFTLNTQWQRLTFTFTAESAGANFQINNEGVLGGLVDAHIWGAQIEEGFFATSYIPTTSTTVTRASDQLSTINSTWFNPLAGTWLIEWQAKISNPIGEQTLFNFGFSDGSNTSSNSTRVSRSINSGTGSHQVSRLSNSTSTTFQITNQTTSDTATSTGINWGGTAPQRFVSSYTKQILMAAESYENSKNMTSKTLNIELPATGNMLSLGYNGLTSSNSLNGHLRKFQYYKISISPELLAY